MPVLRRQAVVMLLSMPSGAGRIDPLDATRAHGFGSREADPGQGEHDGWNGHPVIDLDRKILSDNAQRLCPRLRA
jgi:hypothetical protein